MKVKLGEVAEQIRGVTYKANDVDETLNSNSITLLRANNISNNGVINYDDVIYIKKNKIGSVQLIKQNDILVCTSSGSVHLVGKAAQIKEDKLLSFGAFCKVIRPKNIHAIYLGYFFQSPYYRKTISSLAQGANINNIRNDDIDNLMINIYDDVTTQEIVSILDQVTFLIGKRKSQLEKLDILVKSKFIEMFGDPVLNPKGWEKKKIGEVCDVNKNTLSNNTDPNYSFTYLDLSLVKEGNIQFPKDKITFQNSPLRARRVIKRNDVIIATVRPNLKGFACINFDVDNIIVSTGFAVLTPITNLQAHYLHHLFYTDFLTEQINKVVKGANYPAINSDDIKKFIIPIPPLDLQNQFAFFVEQVEKNKETIKSSLKQLETLYSALMQQYFTV